MTIAAQASFDDLGTPLVDATFVVVDLETTGGSPADSAITEIGAVKVRAGERLGEFQTLVNPRGRIPPFIAVLTGITDEMTAAAPTLRSVLPTLLEWASGAVLVAHNAPFDVGFLRAGCGRLGLDWPGFPVLDTARLARAVLGRDEAPDCRLGTLARVFRTTVQPRHRALDDARATVEVFEALLARVGNLGVHSVEEVQAFSAQVTPEQRRKRYLADGLPRAAGVYLFRDRAGRALYVGKSRDLAARVRQYFVAAERRTRMAEMVGLADRVDHLRCAHAVEAEVRELRMIAEHKPPYNRRSRWPERSSYLVLTDERFPRLSVVHRPPRPEACWIGPFASARAAEAAREALWGAFALRRCSARLGRRPAGRRCALAELGRCPAPCDGGVDELGYLRVAGPVEEAMIVDPAPVVTAAERRLAALAGGERFEEAAAVRDRVAAFLRGVDRRQRLAMLAGCRLLVAAAPGGGAGVAWEVVVVRHGRLAAAGSVPVGAAPRPYVDALLAGAGEVPACGGGRSGGRRGGEPGWPPGAAASAAELECLLRFLGRPGVRLVELDGTLALPVRGAGRWSSWFAGDARRAVDPLADRRGLRPLR
jgi:DNA polymerase-3 subunit epsilon